MSTGTPAEPVHQKKKAGIGCATIAVGIVAIAFLISQCSDSGSDSNDGGGRYGAQSVCEQFVEDRLKSPSTADFSDTETSNVGDLWTVTGAVDSENSFGAMIRNTYRCVVRYSGDDTWNLVSLDSTEN